MNEDDELKDVMDDVEDDADDFDDMPNLGKGKPKAKDNDLVSLSDLEDEEDEPLPDDSFDDQDLW